MQKIVVLVLAAITLFLGSVAYGHYHELRTKQLAATATQLTKERDELTRLNRGIDQLVTRANELYIECDKGVKAWDQLTVARQKEVAKPYCGQAIVE